MIARTRAAGPSEPGVAKQAHALVRRLGACTPLCTDDNEREVVERERDELRGLGTLCEAATKKEVRRPKGAVGIIAAPNGLRAGSGWMLSGSRCSSLCAACGGSMIGERRVNAR